MGDSERIALKRVVPYVKPIASPGSIHEIGWCTGMTLRDGMEGCGGRRVQHGGPMADSCECMAKTTTIL